MGKNRRGGSEWECLRARDVMSHPVWSVRAAAPVREAAETMSSHRVSGLAVLDRGGKAVGVISASDIVLYETTRSGVVMGDRQYERLVAKAGQQLRRGFQIARVDEEDVRSVMTPKIIMTPAETALAEVAALMHREHVHRVFVEENGRILGVVTSFDVIRCVGRGIPAGCAVRRRKGGKG